MYTVRMGSDVAEAQIDDLMPRSTFSWKSTRCSGSRPATAASSPRPGNMFVRDYKGISVTCVSLDPQREFAVLRVDRFPT